MNLKRRLCLTAMAGVPLLLARSRPALAETIPVFANSAHQAAFAGAPGGTGESAQAGFVKATGDTVAWHTTPWPEMRQTLLRLLTASTSADAVVMVINDWATPTLKQKLLPLDALLAQAPVEALDDIFIGMRRPFMQDNKLFGIPIRSNPQILHYNKELLASRDVAPPVSIEALLDAAQAVAGKRADGASVYGLAIKPDEDILAIVRAYGGSVLDPALGIHVREAPVLAALDRLRALYAGGGLPRNFHTMDSTSVQTLMREGLVAMCLFGDNYFLRFNDPKGSRIAGKVWFEPIPGSAALGARYAPAKVTFWAAAMPATLSPARQQGAWRLIRSMASPASQLSMAIAGNGPVRQSTLSDPAFTANAPYAAASKIALDNAIDLLPVFDGSVEVNDIFTEEAVAAIIERKTPTVAMADAQQRIEKVLAKRPAP